MADIIKLLSDSVANQIAAGEVIQRPASVVKELVENSLDAGANKIQIIIKDAGRTLIQIIDNGCGMSPTDARLSFERHATSKISKADDLFLIRTLGFRGEALASIAAVASVELKTKRKEDSIGTLIKISGSKVELQEQVASPDGSNFMIKNLFFNVPARRKFLKTNQTEYRYILNEIYRIVLTNKNVDFHVVFDGKDQLVLKQENLKQRIINVFGKKINQSLVSIQTKTAIININGYISKPERTRKNNQEQYFFVNNRYMYHPYFRKAITMAYDKLIPEGEHPSFFIYFEIDPSNIDVNIHPTKTEIKFEEEQAIFQILNASVKESLGKFNVLPKIDFEDDITRNAHFTSQTRIKPPQIKINPDYNPFDTDKKRSNNFNDFGKSVPKNWEQLYENNYSPNNSNNEEQSPQADNFFFSDNPNSNEAESGNVFFQYKKKYIITSGKSGMIIIDQSRAHQRILFEKFLKRLESRKGIVQKKMFPIELDLNNQERAFLIEVIESLNNIGFEIEMKGSEAFVITGVPGDLEAEDPANLVRGMLEVLQNTPEDIKLVLHEKIAFSLAKAASIKSDKSLREEEMRDIFYNLMSCSNHNFTIDGSKILELITIAEIENKFK